MEFKFIDELGMNIRLDLIPLRRGSQRYKILMYQHEGIFSVGAHKFGNSEPVDSQFNAFFNKAKEINADLVLTPEYSCPWSIIESITSTAEKWPDEGKIWCIGCESITKEEMRNFKNNFLKDDTIIYYDESIHEGNNNFLDPLIYLFKAQKNDSHVLICLIQFKTRHMGVFSGGDIERNNIIEGKDVYIIRNDNQSVYLMSLICSEAMNFRANLTAQKKAHIDWEDKPYLIYHPQLNPNPAHPNFIEFRNFVLASHDKEIISLNWQLNSKIGNREMLSFECSRSGFYIKSTEIVLNKKSRIIKNHKKGLYYFNNKINRHTYLLSSNPHCFLIELPRVKINLQDVQSRRDGPEVIGIFKLNEQKDTLEEMEDVSDKHIEYLTSTACINEFLLDANKCVIDKERLISLTTAQIEDQFQNINDINSIIMDENNEINNRITVAQDRSEGSLERKGIYITTVNALQEIIDQNKFPDNLKELNGIGVKLAYHDDSSTDDYKFNLIMPNGSKIYATVAYLVSSDDTLVGKKYSKLRKLFGSADTRSRERVVIFYKKGHEFDSIWDPKAKNITNTSDYEDESILK